MNSLKVAYRFQEDKEAIERIQSVSKDKNSDYGLKTENGLLVGTKKWFEAIESGVIPKRKIKGQITKVFMSGHNDWPEFELESEEGKSNWTREGFDQLYKVGKHIELTYVIQKYKRPLDILGPTTKKVIEIKIEE